MLQQKSRSRPRHVAKINFYTKNPDENQKKTSVATARAIFFNYTHFPNENQQIFVFDHRTNARTIIFHRFFKTTHFSNASTPLFYFLQHVLDGNNIFHGAPVSSVNMFQRFFKNTHFSNARTPLFYMAVAVRFFHT